VLVQLEPAPRLFFAVDTQTPGDLAGELDAADAARGDEIAACDG